MQLTTQIGNNVHPAIMQTLAVDQKDCHKSRRENGFITDARRDAGDNAFVLTANVDHGAENFFFDHSIDHIPGMLIACILRQSVLVISHKFYDIDFDRSFIMDDIEMKFSSHAELNTPIDVYARFEKIGLRRDELRSALCVVDILQNGKVVSSGSLSFRAMSPEIMRRLQAKQTKVNGGKK